MVRFEPDMEDIRATTRIFEQGDYELKVKRVRGFAYTREQDGVEIYGADVNFEMVGPLLSDGTLGDDFAGEDVSRLRTFWHTKGAMEMSKRNVMAIAGFSREEEEEFNAWVKDGNSFAIIGDDEDPEADVELGSGWQQLVGNRVHASLTVQLYQRKDDDGNPVGEPEEQQNFQSLRPVS